MEFLYSSMYIKEKITSFDDLVSKVNEPAQIEIILDTNICCFMRDFFREPNLIVSREDVWTELKSFLEKINQYDVILNIGLGVEESSRSKESFEVIPEKFTESYHSIINLYKMNFSTIMEHAHSGENKPPFKDMSEHLETKMPSLNSKSEFQRFMFLSYAAILKIFILEKTRSQQTNFDLVIEFLDFLNEDIDLISVSHMQFASFYFSGNTVLRKLIHPKSKKTKDIIHGFWNAAIDLTFPALIGSMFVKNHTVPVFVTSDKVLYTIFDSIKVRGLFIDGDDGIVAPPIIEVDYSESKWTTDEIGRINRHYNMIRSKRGMKSALMGFTLDIDSFNNRLMELCFRLEKQAKEIMEN